MIRLDAGAKQVDVPLDEHARLASTRGRFEDDVLRRIDGSATRIGISEVRLCTWAAAVVRLKPDATSCAEVRLKPDPTCGGVRL